MSLFGGTRLTEISMLLHIGSLGIAGLGAPLALIAGYESLAFWILGVGFVCYLQAFLVPWREQR